MRRMALWYDMIYEMIWIEWIWAVFVLECYCTVVTVVEMIQFNSNANTSNLVLLATWPSLSSWLCWVPWDVLLRVRRRKPMIFVVWWTTSQQGRQGDRAKLMHVFRPNSHCIGSDMAGCFTKIWHCEKWLGYLAEQLNIVRWNMMELVRRQFLNSTDAAGIFRLPPWTKGKLLTLSVVYITRTFIRSLVRVTVRPHVRSRVRPGERCGVHSKIPRSPSAQV